MTIPSSTIGRVSSCSGDSGSVASQEDFNGLWSQPHARKEIESNGARAWVYQIQPGSRPQGPRMAFVGHQQPAAWRVGLNPTTEKMTCWIRGTVFHAKFTATPRCSTHIFKCH